MNCQQSEIKKTRIDYHCHLLPGIDDGARHLEDSLSMARLLVEAGFETVYCTPHCIRGVYDTPPESVPAAVSELQSELDSANIQLQLFPGMEYYLDEYFPQAIENPVPLGKSQLLLVEAPPNVHPLMVEENIFYAVRQGFTPLIAHPERVAFLAPEIEKNGFFSKLKSTLFSERVEPDSALGNLKLDTLLQQGCLFQANIGSFAGYYGRAVQKRVQFFEAAGLYTYYGSDGHRPDQLKWCLDRGLSCLSSTSL